MSSKALVRATLAALVALGVAACIIGPKQDDPASDLAPKDDAGADIGTGIDLDAAEDAPVVTPSDDGGDAAPSGDTATPDAAPDGCSSDAADADDAGCASDASSDDAGADVLEGD